jgi:hypothetical protein
VLHRPLCVLLETDPIAWCDSLHVTDHDCDITEQHMPDYIHILIALNQAGAAESAGHDSLLLGREGAPWQLITMLGCVEMCSKMVVDWKGMKEARACTWVGVMGIKK